jgi:hypothetical protein
LPRAEIAAPSLPADHCEIAVNRGFPASWANDGMASTVADPASRLRLVVSDMVGSSGSQMFVDPHL